MCHSQLDGIEYPKEVQDWAGMERREG
jgi:hypothetical protein